nr:MAG TPA: DNA mismatch endonuclease [Caudoviricetes sp.]
MSSSFPTGGVAVECDGCAPLGGGCCLFWSVMCCGGEVE